MIVKNALKIFFYVKKDTLLITIFSFIAAILVFAPAIYRPSMFQMMGGDVYHNLWIWGRNFSNLMNGVSPYTPNIFFPDAMSSFYSEMEIGNSILYGLLTLIGLHPIQSYLTIVVLSFALTCIMVALISRRLGASTGAAIIGGAIAAFASYRYNHLVHIQALATYWALLPLYFSLSYLMVGMRRDLVLAFIMHIPILCGPSYNLIGLILLETGIFLAFVLEDGFDKKQRLKRALFLVFAVVLAGLLTTPFWLGYLKLFKNGLSRDHNDLTAHAMNLLSFLTPPDSSRFYSGLLNAIKTEGRGTLSINSIFLGFIATYFLGRAIFGSLLPLPQIQFESRAYPLQFLRAIKWTGIIFLLFSLGSIITWGNTHLLPNPVFSLGEITHLLSATRYIAHYAYFGIVALSIIVAYQVSYILPNFRPTVRIGLHAGLAILVILESLVVYAPNVASLPNQLANVPQIYRQLAELPSGKGVVFLPLPTSPNNVDDVYRRQFEYMFNSQYHRLAMFNGISGFFPSHYTQGLGLLSEFPNLPGLNLILKDHIDFVVYDKHSGQPMDFSKEKINSVCPSSLASIYADADYELFQVNHVRGMQCLAQAGVNALEQWIFLPSKATPHQIGQYDDTSKSMATKQGEQGALVFGQNLALDEGRYRVIFPTNTPNSGVERELGTVDVYGTGKEEGHIYASSKIYSANQKQVLQLEFDVTNEQTKFEFRGWSNGSGAIELSKIMVEKR